MPLAIVTPICEAKAYAWHDFVRGVLLQDVDHREIHWVFVVQENGGLDRLSPLLDELEERAGERFASITRLHHTLPYDARFFDPRDSSLTWEMRARFAADLRGEGLAYVRDHLPDVPHVLSLGCDVCLNDPGDVDRLLDVDQAIVSGVLQARVRDFPLVLHYNPDYKGTDPTKLWDYWIDYPKDEVFACDWTGMDIFMLAREVIEAVDLRRFQVADYGVGEDGWFCLEAKKQGFTTWVEPHVTPWHVNSTDSVYGPDAPRPGLLIRCPGCRTEGRGVKTYANVGGRCSCGTYFYPDPWWEERRECEAPYRLLGGA
jgi:hypothetical protein